MERSIFGLLLAKVETTYGTDPTPTAAANVIAIPRTGFKFDPAFQHLTRQILDGTLGRVSGFNALPEVSFSFDVELRGNRTDGTAADISAGSAAHAIEIDPLLQACDLAATYTAESVSGARDGNVIYKPTVPTDQGVSVTFYLYSGLKLHKITGCKGSLKGTCEAGQIPKLTFDFKGRYNAITDASIPSSPVFLNTKPPLFLAAGSTIDTFSPVFQKLDFDLGAKVERRTDANSTDGVAGFMITDRDSKCSIDPESVAEGTSPIWADLYSAQARVISASAGSQTGNKVAMTFHGVSNKVTYGDRSGIRTQQIDYAIERTNISDSAGSEFQLKFS